MGFELHKGQSVCFSQVHCYPDRIERCRKETVWPRGSRQEGNSHKNVMTLLSENFFSHLIWTENQIFSSPLNTWNPEMYFFSLSRCAPLQDSLRIPSTSALSAHQRSLALSLPDALPTSCWGVNLICLFLSLSLCLGTSAVLSIMVSISVAKKWFDMSDSWLKTKIQESEKLYFYFNWIDKPLYWNN